MILTAFDPPASAPAAARPVLKMVPHPRMGGTVPVWEKAGSPQERVEAALTHAAAPAQDSFSAALSYAAQERYPADRPFGFGDLVDMVNPLHHVPVVGALYRGLTGDDIRPIGRIIGSTVYGGPAGGAAGLVNVIARHETGRDLAGNVIAAATGGNPGFVHSSGNIDQSLPGTAVAVADLGSEGVAAAPKTVWKLND